MVICVAACGTCGLLCLWHCRQWRRLAGRAQSVEDCCRYYASVFWWFEALWPAGSVAVRVWCRVVVVVVVVQKVEVVRRWKRVLDRRGRWVPVKNKTGNDDSIAMEAGTHGLCSGRSEKECTGSRSRCYRRCRRYDREGTGVRTSKAHDDRVGLEGCCRGKKSVSAKLGEARHPQQTAP